MLFPLFKKTRGFTLIESILVIIVMGFAMLIVIQFLSPQVHRSADHHYYSRTAALGQSVMSMILARGFDEKSDFDGGTIRCGEGTPKRACSSTLGPDGEATVALYNDVDDYHGCWEPAATNGCRDLASLLGEGGATTYHYYRLNVNVTLDIPEQLKKITLEISALDHPSIVLNAYRGNF